MRSVRCGLQYSFAAAADRGQNQLCPMDRRSSATVKRSQSLTPHEEGGDRNEWEKTFPPPNTTDGSMNPPRAAAPSRACASAAARAAGQRGTARAAGAELKQRGRHGAGERVVAQDSVAKAWHLGRGEGVRQAAAESVRAEVEAAEARELPNAARHLHAAYSVERDSMRMQPSWQASRGNKIATA